MLNFKKLASTFIFSVLAFQSTVFAVTRYAKVVLLGGKGSGKTTIQKLINKDYNIDNIPHTTQISYISVPVFYDNKGNFTFDEDRDVQRYNKKVILNICDTPSADDINCDYNTEEYKKQAKNNEKLLKCVDEFALKGPNVIVALANAENFSINEDWDLSCDSSFVHCCQNMINENGFNSRKIFILTHYNTEYKDNEEKVTSMSFLKSLNKWRGFDRTLDTLSILTLKNEINEKNKGINKSEIETKLDINDKMTISKEINLEYIAKQEEIFNKNSEESLKECTSMLLNLIARSVYKYGINNLPLVNNDSDWTIIDGKLVKGH